MFLTEEEPISISLQIMNSFRCLEFSSAEIPDEMSVYVIPKAPVTLVRWCTMCLLAPAEKLSSELLLDRTSVYSRTGTDYIELWIRIWYYFHGT